MHTYAYLEWPPPQTRAGRILRLRIVIFASLHASHGRTSVPVPLPLPMSKLHAAKTEARLGRAWGWGNSSRRECWRRSARRLSAWLRGRRSAWGSSTSEAPGLAAARGGEHWAPAQSERTQGDDASLNNKEKQLFDKYMKYKRHEETRITCLLRCSCSGTFVPLSNMAGYDLRLASAQDKIASDRLPLGCSAWEAQEDDWSGEREE